MNKYSLTANVYFAVTSHASKDGIKTATHEFDNMMTDKYRHVTSDLRQTVCVHRLAAACEQD